MKTSPPDIPGAAPARYLVGIDLGTTNCAVAYVDTMAPGGGVRDFLIPQLVAPGETEARPVLPSFGYEPAPGEFSPGSLTVAGGVGDGPLVGWLAQRLGAQTPGRLIASAKSWLCHPGVDRTAPLLPWQGAPEVTRISPVEASTRYLAHLRAAWDAAFPGHPLNEQEVVVAVPASFDEVARELTVRAAEQAGLKQLTLIEEPQAVFYAWMAGKSGADTTKIRPGQLTLICDVGGGTTDFTLIEARPDNEGGVRFHRVAVGDHLILGGDNMDLALAHHIEGRLGSRLDPRRWGVLVQNCRQAKETLLGANAPDRMAVSVASGPRLIGGAVQVEITRAEVEALLLDGFFPRVERGERPASVRSGFQEFGLPYAADAAVTRHLAAFLASHSAGIAADGAKLRFPDQVLFNGGVFESARLQQRLLDVLHDWRRDAVGPNAAPLIVLPNERLDLAVARGAAYSRWLRRRDGRRIAAGLARGYYVQVGRTGDSTPTAVCLAPAGLEEGNDVELPQTFLLRLRQPVEFALFSSSTRTLDQPGDVIPIDPTQLSPLPSISTVIRSGRSRDAGTAEVRLHGRLTEIGTLDVRCAEIGRNRSWKLEFDVRGTSHRSPRAPRGDILGPDDALEEGLIRKCAERIRHMFQPTTESANQDPAWLIRHLEEDTGLERQAWPLPLLRALWDELMEVEIGRQRSVMHETRWLNLLGFALRPGFGYPIDDWRVQRTWKLVPAGTLFPRNEMCRAEWWILWRRVGGGLGAGHQRALIEPLVSVFRAKGGRKEHRGLHETAEIWRLLGALELLSVPLKIELGDHLAGLLERRLEPVLLKAVCWAFGRIGARVPAYGPLNALVPTDVAEAWLTRLQRNPPADQEALFAAVQMARRTGDRYRDISDETRTNVVAWLQQQEAPEHQLTLVRDGGELAMAEEAQVFGEALPPGLHFAGE
ncbi:MAG TPA: Hsp70 family protein [Verrucomicrobiota bacterium]|nr:Hsp70 family protein [Verrucomicrobiota bacterium]